MTHEDIRLSKNINWQTAPQPPSGVDPELFDEAELLEALSLRFSWVSRRRLEQELDAYGLTAPQYMALRCMVQNSQGCSMTELAESSHQVSATMTGIIDRLEERGLVLRERDPRDRRAMRVVLTQAGKDLMTQVNESKRAMTLKALAKLEPEERRVLIEMTQRYLEVMENEVRSS